MSYNTKLALILLLVVLMIGIGPLITIWWLNTLFLNGAIAYSLKTWFATALMHLTVAGLFNKGK